MNRTVVGLLALALLLHSASAATGAPATPPNPTLEPTGPANDGSSWFAVGAARTHG
jgi:hypothetical protein